MCHDRNCGCGCCHAKTWVVEKAIAEGHLPRIRRGGRLRNRPSPGGQRKADQDQAHYPAPGSRAITVSRRLWFEAGMANSPSSDSQQNGADRQATVLVVDDDPALQTMILDYFADNNIQTLLASGREEMLRQLSGQEVDVVILDLRLGVEDGLDALRELRSRFDLLVICATSGASARDHSEAGQ